MKKNFRIWIYSFVLIASLTILVSSCKKSEDNTLTDVVDNIDIDGNVYTTITIGTQTWMVENLRTTKYQNGDPIQNVKDNSTWSTQTKGALCDYNNNEANGSKFGKIYNWHAVNDARKLAPNGWHIPSDAEWAKLTNYLSSNIGASSSVAKALAAKTDWIPSIEVGTVGNDLTKNNGSGFTALPGGIRGINGPSGIFGWLNTSSWFWSSSAFDASFASARGMNNTDKGNLQNGGFFKTDGLSVRCIKD